MSPPSYFAKAECSSMIHKLHFACCRAHGVAMQCTSCEVECACCHSSEDMLLCAVCMLSGTVCKLSAYSAAIDRSSVHFVNWQQTSGNNLSVCCQSHCAYCQHIGHMLRDNMCQCSLCYCTSCINSLFRVYTDKRMPFPLSGPFTFSCNVCSESRRYFYFGSCG